MDNPPVVFFFYAQIQTHSGALVYEVSSTMLFHRLNLNTTQDYRDFYNIVEFETLKRAIYIYGKFDKEKHRAILINLNRLSE